MKNILLRAVSASFLAAILMLGSSMMISDATAAPPASQVVIFTCSGEPTLSGGIIVQTASSSAGAPSVTMGSSCSQALQDVVSAGFKIVESTFSGSGFSGSFAFILQK